MIFVFLLTFINGSLIESKPLNTTLDECRIMARMYATGTEHLVCVETTEIDV